MPYKDPEKRRQASRESRRRIRAAEKARPGRRPLTEAQDRERRKQIAKVRADATKQAIAEAVANDGPLSIQQVQNILMKHGLAGDINALGKLLESMRKDGVEDELTPSWVQDEQAACEDLLVARLHYEKNVRAEAEKEAAAKEEETP